VCNSRGSRTILLTRRLLPTCSLFSFYCDRDPRDLHSFPTRRSSDLVVSSSASGRNSNVSRRSRCTECFSIRSRASVQRLRRLTRSEEHTSELQSRFDLVCRLLLEKKKNDPPSIQAP